MIQSDRLEIEKADAKNSVEEYVYEMREKLEGVLSQFVNDEVQYIHIVRFITLDHFSKTLNMQKQFL